LGELRVTRRDGQIVNVELADFEEAVKRYAAVRADFSAHTNPPGTMVDFGVIATDGSVKINLAQDGLTVFPYPRDREFTVVIDPKKAVANGAIDLARITVDRRAPQKIWASCRTASKTGAWCSKPGSRAPGDSG